MGDRPQIIAGLLVFVGLFTFPFWHARASKTASAPPPIKLPVNEKQCVAPTSYMLTSHMELLGNWRNEVVRQDQRQFRALDGKVYEKSLTRTCMLECHKDKTEFCNRCHTYSGVPSCYCCDCHVEPQLIARRTP